MALIGESLPELVRRGGRGLGSQASKEAGSGDCRAGSIYARAWSGTGGEVETQQVDRHRHSKEEGLWVRNSLESHRDSEISEVTVTK